MQAEIVVRLDEIIKYLKPLLPLANCHLVNFITNGMWEVYVPDAIKKEVSSLKMEVFNTVFLQYAKEIPVAELNRELTENIPNFINFLDSARNMYLNGTLAQGIVTSLSDLQQKLSGWGYEYQENMCIEEFMTQKKIHEVQVMSQVVAALACISQASHVVDVGGGKGYLSSILALHHGLRVLGVDSSQINTHGAAKRTQKLEKRWSGLCRRAIILNQGNVPPRRGKHWKSLNNKMSSKGSECNGAEGTTISKPQSQRSALYKQVTVFVTQQTNLVSLVKEHFECEECEHLSLTGLHTCGDLAPACFRIFASKEDISSMTNIGCCYHLVEEEYVRNPFWTDVDPPLPTGVQCGFPMSQHLHMQKFSLGRNARMLAAHSMERVGECSQLSSEPLFYRALLQVLLLKKCDNDIPWGQVGRRLKYQHFVDYIQKAVQKLRVNIEVSTDEIESLYKNHSIDQEQLHVFFLLRLALAPVIEAVILLDRLLYLHEQGIQDSYLVQLFDPVISPRCYCIVSLKNSPVKRTD